MNKNSPEAKREVDIVDLLVWFWWVKKFLAFGLAGGLVFGLLLALFQYEGEVVKLEYLTKMRLSIDDEFNQDMNQSKAVAAVNAYSDQLSLVNFSIKQKQPVVEEGGEGPVMKYRTFWDFSLSHKKSLPKDEVAEGVRIKVEQFVRASENQRKAKAKPQIQKRIEVAVDAPLIKADDPCRGGVKEDCYNPKISYHAGLKKRVINEGVDAAKFKLYKELSRQEHFIKSKDKSLIGKYEIQWNLEVLEAARASVHDQVYNGWDGSRTISFSMILARMEWITMKLVDLQQRGLISEANLVGRVRQLKTLETNYFSLYSQMIRDRSNWAEKLKKNNLKKVLKPVFGPAEKPKPVPQPIPVLVDVKRIVEKASIPGTPMNKNLSRLTFGILLGLFVGFVVGSIKIVYVRFKTRFDGHVENTEPPLSPLKSSK